MLRDFWKRAWDDGSAASCEAPAAAQGPAQPEVAALVAIAEGSKTGISGHAESLSFMSSYEQRYIKCQVSRHETSRRAIVLFCPSELLVLPSLDLAPHQTFSRVYTRLQPGTSTCPRFEDATVGLRLDAQLPKIEWRRSDPDISRNFRCTDRGGAKLQLRLGGGGQSYPAKRASQLPRGGAGVQAGGKSPATQPRPRKVTQRNRSVCQPACRPASWVTCRPQVPIAHSGSQAARQACGQAVSQAVGQLGRETGMAARQPGSQAGSQAARQPGSQAARQPASFDRQRKPLRIWTERYLDRPA